MNRTWRDLLPGLMLLLVASTGAPRAEAALFSPAAAPQAPAPSPTEIQADPVLSAIDAIGQAGALPRIAEIPNIAAAAAMSGGEGSADTVFAGGTASTVGGLRFLEGISDARDPLQLLPAEPSLAQRIPVPAAAGLLLGGLLSLAVLRRRSRRRALPA